MSRRLYASPLGFGDAAREWAAREWAALGPAVLVRSGAIDAEELKLFLCAPSRTTDQTAIPATPYLQCIVHSLPMGRRLYTV